MSSGLIAASTDCAATSAISTSCLTSSLDPLDAAAPDDELPKN